MCVSNMMTSILVFCSDATSDLHLTKIAITLFAFASAFSTLGAELGRRLITVGHLLATGKKRR